MEFQSRGPTHVVTLVPYNCSEKVSMKCRLVLVAIAGVLDNVKRASSSVGRTLVNFLCITVMSCCLAMSLTFRMLRVLKIGSECASLS